MVFPNTSSFYHLKYVGNENKQVMKNDCTRFGISHIIFFYRPCLFNHEESIEPERHTNKTFKKTVMELLKQTLKCYQYNFDINTDKGSSSCKIILSI